MGGGDATRPRGAGAAPNSHPPQALSRTPAMPEILILDAAMVTPPGGGTARGSGRAGGDRALRM